MKHINDPPPDLRALRPDVPLRLVAAIERALEKDPANRFGSMDQFAWELKQCLAEMGAPDADRTFIAPSPVLRESRPHTVRPARPRRRWPIYALVLLIAAAAIVAGVLTLGGSNGKKDNSGTSKPTVPLPLNGVGAYDPDGGDGEHDSVAYRATDGDVSTYWDTEHYNTFQKRGVGVVLDAGRSVKAKVVTVRTDTPGFTASILAGSSPSGPFTTDSGSETVNGSATFTLRNRTARYYVVWITNLGSNVSVHVNEVRAKR
jgi:hypothetical protein